MTTPGRHRMTSIFGTPEFETGRAVREYLERVKSVNRVAGSEIEAAGDELMDRVRRKAKIYRVDLIIAGALVRRQFNRTAELERAAAASAARTWLAYLKYFGVAIEMENEQKKNQGIKIGEI